MDSQTTKTQEFYNQLTPFYHLVYPDWEQSVKNQAQQLDAIIKTHWGHAVNELLDVACGIGTQSLGLAELGYAMTGSDLSVREIARAKQEAQRRNLNLDLSVADMRQVFEHHQRQFDLIIACDNAVPHLLTDDDIRQAFRQCYACARPNGGLLITVRDYDREERSGNQFRPGAIRPQGDTRYLMFQVWDFDGDCYDIAIYVVEDTGLTECTTQVVRTRYYAIGTDRLIRLMSEAGFMDVQRLDNVFFQPVIIGHKR